MPNLFAFMSDWFDHPIAGDKLLAGFLTWTEELQASWTARAQAGRSGAPAGSTRDLSQPRSAGAFSRPESPIVRKKAPACGPGL
jgi:hypothetical protein